MFFDKSIARYDKVSNIVWIIKSNYNAEVLWDNLNESMIILMMYAAYYINIFYGRTYMVVTESYFKSKDSIEIKEKITELFCRIINRNL